MYVGPKTAVKQLNHQLVRNESPPNAPAFGQVGTERPYGGITADRKNYIVSIRKRRGLVNLYDGKGNDEAAGWKESKNKTISAEDIRGVVKRSMFDESRKKDDGIDQESVLESLTSDESDGDDMLTSTYVNGKKHTNSALKITGSAVATPVKGAGADKDVKSVVQKHDESKPGRFRLIEQASYRPNDLDSDRNKELILSTEDVSEHPLSESKRVKSNGPVVVNLPLSNGIEAARDDLRTKPSNGKSAPPQGTSLDLLTSFNRMNTPDPRETSSYTEAHLDNPNINAVASAKIYHGDNAQSTGRTSTNVEITGVGGSQAGAEKELPVEPNVDSSVPVTQPEQNVSDSGEERPKDGKGNQEAAESENKGRVLPCSFFAVVIFITSY